MNDKKQLIKGRAPVSMKRLAPFGVSALTAVALIIYMNTVAPEIDKPFVIMGFFMLVFLTLASGLYGVVRTTKKLARVVVSVTVSLSVTYLVAVSSLGRFGLDDILVVVVVDALIVILGSRRGDVGAL